MSRSRRRLGLAWCFKAFLVARNLHMAAKWAAPDVAVGIADVYVFFRNHVELLQRVRVLRVCHISQILRDEKGTHRQQSCSAILSSPIQLCH